ncbi:MAG: hypothetical protein RR942_06005 [Romboutsia sp.]
MKLGTIRVKLTGKHAYIYIECRNCNTYIEVEKKTGKYKCNKCGKEGHLAVID